MNKRLAVLMARILIMLVSFATSTSDTPPSNLLLDNPSVYALVEHTEDSAAMEEHRLHDEAYANPFGLQER